jgi:hypothetical protein
MGAMCVVKSDLHTPVPNGSRICGEEKLAYYAVPNECRIRSEDIPAHTMVPLGAMSVRRYMHSNGPQREPCRS